MKYVLGVLLLLAPERALAGGAFACTDACSRDPRTGMSCADQGLGCNPSTRICVQCSDDLHCLPNGTCANNMCINLVCTYDAGADGGDATPADAEDGGGMDADPADADPVDADPVDADPADADPADAPPIDVAFPDARDPTIPLGGPRGMTAPKDPFDPDDCGCTATHRGGSAAWILLGLLLIAQRKWY